MSTCNRFKTDRMTRIKQYEGAYNGQLKEQMRRMFNIPFPVFSGLVDALVADFNDPINLVFKENDPADYNPIRKVQAAWDKQVGSLYKDAMWKMKLQLDRFNAIMSGRGILKFYTESDPKFRAVFNVINYQNFIFEPQGGWHLENHLFCGEDNIQKTDKELEDAANDGLYYADTVDWILNNKASDQYKDMWKGQADFDIFSQYKAMGLDPESENYVGQFCIYGAEIDLTYEGERYYLFFDPWTQKPLRAEKLEDMTESNLYQYVSWATHPNQKNFLSKSYADDFYPIHEGTGRLLNQELTGREMVNNPATFYDPQMYPDVNKLDKIGYRPGLLVPGNTATANGVKKLSDGVYQFSRGEVKGTLDILGWMQTNLTQLSGVYEANQAGGKGSSGGKGAQVQYALLQQAQKRLSPRSDSYSQAYSEIGFRFMEGLKENMPASMWVRMAGNTGYGAWDELKRSDLNFKDKVSITIINVLEADKDNVLGKDQRLKWLQTVLPNQFLVQQYNPKVLAEMSARDIGGLKDEMITDLMDTTNFATKDVMSQADYAINQLVKGKMPEVCYQANLAFLRRILDFEKAHMTTLKEKHLLFDQYISAHKQIVTENMASLAQQLKLQNTQAMPQNGQPAQGQQGQGQPQDQQQPQGQGQPQQQPQQTPQTQPTSNIQGPQRQMADMSVGGGQ